MTSPGSSPSTPSGPRRWARKAAVLVIGGTVLLVGLAMIVLPGPAVVVIPAGLAILATEFVWARRLLERAHAQFHAAAEKVKRARAAKAPPREPAGPEREPPAHARREREIARD